MRRAATLEQQAARLLATALTQVAGTEEPREEGVKEKQLEWVPPGKPQWHAGWINGWARGLQVIANHLNGPAGLPPVDYDTAMGDLGAAFAMQADADSLKRYDGHHDVGWWPMEPLCFVRLGFLARTTGREIREVAGPAKGPATDFTAFYRRRFEPAVRSSVDDRKPCLAGFGDWWCIVTGYDTRTPCLYGMCTNQKEGEEKVDRVELDRPPGWLLVFGDVLHRIDRKAADREALRFAIKLHHDRVLGTGAEQPEDSPLRGARKGYDGWCTGVNAFRCWEEWTRDERREQVARTHANSKGFLVRNRRTAIRYLRAMRQRHPKPVAYCLDNAILRYEEVIRETSALDTSPNGVSTPEGRLKMVAGIERIIEIENGAVAALERAVEVME